MDLPQSIFWGFLPGLITSAIGAYKDTLYEEFENKKFFRSTIITFLWYILINYIYPKEPVILKIGMCSMMERITVELYKAFHKPAPGKFKNCTCKNNSCIIHKDRGWMIDRITGSAGNYTGAFEKETP